MFWFSVILIGFGLVLLFVVGVLWLLFNGLIELCGLFSIFGLLFVVIGWLFWKYY